MEDVEKVYRAYVVWEAKPPTNPIEDPSYPQDEDAFCLLWKCKREDLTSFASRETYADDVMSATMNWAKTKTPKLIQEVYLRCRATKNVQDLERFLSPIHEFKRKDKESKSLNQYNFFTNGVSDDRYERIIAREAQRLATGGTEQPS